MKAFHPALAFSLRRPLRKQARAPVLAPWPSSEREGLSGAGGVEMGAKVGQINTEEDPLLISTSVDYEKLQQLGEGVRGQVYMARDIHTGEIVTLKKINEGDENEGVPVWLVCETRILRMLHHENIIQLKHTFMSREGVDGIYRGSTYMVFEYMPSSLKNLVEHPEVKMTAPQIKTYMLQLLRGLQYCHANGVLHRNIKGTISVGTSVISYAMGHLEGEEFQDFQQPVSLSSRDYWELYLLHTRMESQKTRG